MFSFCDTAEYCVYVIASRLAVVLSFMLAGVLLNGTILWIHQRNKTLPGRLYIVMLAVLDVYGSVCLLSTAALWELRVISNPPFFHQVIFQKTSYLFVQLAMLFDRIFAVFARSFDLAVSGWFSHDVLLLPWCVLQSVLVRSTVLCCG